MALPEADQLLAQIYEKDPRRSFILYQFLVDMERNLEEVRRVLKSGGRYVVAIGSNRMRGYAVESWRHIMGLVQRGGAGGGELLLLGDHQPLHQSAPRGEDRVGRDTSLEEVIVLVISPTYVGGHSTPPL